MNDHSLQATLKKNGMGTVIFAVILILLPIIITFFIGVLGDDFSALPIGLAISAVMMLLAYLCSRREVRGVSPKAIDFAAVLCYPVSERRWDCERE